MAAGIVLAATSDYLGFWGYILSTVQIQPRRCAEHGNDSLALPDQLPATLLRVPILKTEDLLWSMPLGPIYRPLSMTR